MPMPKIIRQYPYLAAFTTAYVLGFSAFFAFRENYEFLLYVVVVLLIAGLVVSTQSRTRFDGVILWGLSLWGLLHMAGGGVPAGEGVLYGLTLVPLLDAGGELVILRYDQAVHLFGFAVATLVVYHLLRPYLSSRPSWPILIMVVAMAGTGLGVLNEIVEFAAVLILPETGVGGYFNTALDLVFNTLGALAAVFYIAYYREEKVYAPQYGFLSRVKQFLHLKE